MPWCSALARSLGTLVTALDGSQPLQEVLEEARLTHSAVWSAVVRGLVEGGSVRSVARLMGAQKNTVLRLLAEVGEFCAIYQHYALRNLRIERVEADEIWAFCGAKQKNATKPGQGDRGDRKS